MNQYHKIENIYLRDTVTNKLIDGEYRLPEYKYLANLNWIATEKIDGTNIRIKWDGKDITFAGKSDNAQLHGDLVKRLQELFLPLKNLFAEKFPDKQVCLYGEGYGAGIQTGGCYKQTKDFILFDVWIDGLWLERGNVQGIAEMCGIDIVPIMKIGTLQEIVDMIKAGQKSTFGDFLVEGVVARPETELFNRYGERVIVKIKTKELKV